MPIDFQPLLLFLGAKSQEIVDTVLVNVFRFRHEGVPAVKRQQWAAELGDLTTQRCDELCLSVDALIRSALFHDLTEEEIVVLFPADFHASLKGLLSKLVASHLNEWKQLALSNQVSGPKLVDFDWRVDMKTSSNFLAKMSVPTVLVEMQLQMPPTQKGVMPGFQNVQFELPKESLATMLDGLTKIRDQLGSIKEK